MGLERCLRGVQGHSKISGGGAAQDSGGLAADARTLLGLPWGRTGSVGVLSRGVKC